MGGATVAGQVGHKREKAHDEPLQCELQCIAVLGHAIFQNLGVGRATARSSTHALMALPWASTDGDSHGRMPHKVDQAAVVSVY
jgi:hypothetical protein